jgi:hypothetical protein
MIYEKEYIFYLITESDKTDVKYILDNYLGDNLEFNDLIKMVDELNINVLTYRCFLKSKKMDDII